MSKTKIPWTEVTLNPFVGCTKIAIGCKNCYAERIHNQRHGAYLAGKKMLKQYAKPFSEVQIIPERIEQPLHWRKPRRIFWCSMSDMFHPDVPFSEIDKVMAVIALTPLHTHQILTKRIERALYHARYPSGTVPSEVLKRNLWFGVSCSTQADADKNIPILLKIPTVVHYVSFEPLLENTDLRRLHYGFIESKPVVYNALESYQGHEGLDWVIIGCEKLAGNKPGRFCQDEQQWWSACRSIVNQCKEAGVAVFVKQGPVNGKVSSEPGDWDEDMRKREYPS